MTIMKADTKKRKVELTGFEIENIINELEYSNHNLFVFLNYQTIINKLKKAKRKGREK